MVKTSGTTDRYTEGFALSSQLAELLQQLRQQPELIEQLRALSQASKPTSVELHATLQPLLEQGRALQDELSTLLALLEQHPQLLTDEQLESVAAGRLDLPGTLVMLASSLTLFSSDGAALIGTSLGVAALSNAMPVQAVPSNTPTPQAPGFKAGPWIPHALEIIKAFEGLELEAYIDAVGVVTIGWGTTLYADGRPVKMGDTVSAEQAEHLLVESIVREYAPGVFKALPMAHGFSPRQQAALISFTYNVGVEALNSSTLRQRLLAGEHPTQVIRQELPRWRFGDKGESLAGLVRRRAAEVTLFQS